MIKHFLAFEKQIADLEGKIEELRHLSSGSDINIAEEIGKLQASVSEKLKSTYIAMYHECMYHRTFKILIFPNQTL